MTFHSKRISAVLLLSAAVVFVTGCGASPPAEGDANSSPAAGASAENTEYSGWWCVEHGIPEGICAQCSTQLAADFQQKGDWCKEHNRPESQCFICHPELEAKFAAQYEAKFGQQPPKRTE